MRCQKCGKKLDDNMNYCPVCNTQIQQNTYNAGAGMQQNGFAQQNYDAPQFINTNPQPQQFYQQTPITAPINNGNPYSAPDQNQQGQPVGVQNNADGSNNDSRSMGATVLDFSLRIALIFGILVYEILASASAADVVISIVILTMLILSMVYSIYKKKKQPK